MRKLKVKEDEAELLRVPGKLWEDLGRFQVLNLPDSLACCEGMESSGWAPSRDAMAPWTALLVPSAMAGTSQGDAPKKSCRWPRPAWVHGSRWFISELLLSDNHYKTTMWNSLCFLKVHLPTKLFSINMCVYVDFYRVNSMIICAHKIIYKTPWIQTPLPQGPLSWPSQVQS